MGIVNVTPDSFSDGGLFSATGEAINHAKNLAASGADIIDIGGESSRPGSQPVALEEELKRVIPLIEELARRIDVSISIDTCKSEVARQALKAGAEIINDISALQFDPGMAEVARKFRAPVVLMHMQGTPRTMQDKVRYQSLIPDIIRFLRERIETAEAAGIDPEKIIIDPGIGFGKSVERDNLLIIKRLAEFKSLKKPILIGTSRKAFIGKILDSGINEREEGTAATITAAILNGANIVRVHNVKKMKVAAKVADAIKYVA